MIRSLLVCEEHPARSVGGIALRSSAAAAALDAAGRSLVEQAHSWRSVAAAVRAALVPAGG